MGVAPPARPAPRGSASGARTIALCSLRLSTAATVSVAPGTEMLVAGTTTSSVAPIVVKSKCSGTPWSHRWSMQRRTLGQLLHRGAARRRATTRRPRSSSSDGASERRGADPPSGGGQRRTLVRGRQRDHVAERRQRPVARVVDFDRKMSTTIPPCEWAMRSTSRPGCSRCMARSCRARRRGVDRDRTERVGRGVRAAVGRVREVADLALVAVVPERLHVERDGRAVPRASLRC